MLVFVASNADLTTDSLKSRKLMASVSFGR